MKILILILFLLLFDILSLVLMSCSACNSKNVYPEYGACLRLGSSENSSCRRSIFSGVESGDCSSIIQSYEKPVPSVMTIYPTKIVSSPIQRVMYMNFSEDGPQSEMEIKAIPLTLQMVLRKNHASNPADWTGSLDRILPAGLGGSPEWYNLVVSSKIKRETPSSSSHSLFHSHSSQKQKQVYWKTIELELVDYLNSSEKSQVEYDVVLNYDQENPNTLPKIPTGFLLCLRFPDTDKQEVVHYFSNQSRMKRTMPQPTPTSKSKSTSKIIGENNCM